MLCLFIYLFYFYMFNFLNVVLGRLGGRARKEETNILWARFFFFFNLFFITLDSFFGRGSVACLYYTSSYYKCMYIY